jgi:hypothetical protein
LGYTAIAVPTFPLFGVDGGANMVENRRFEIPQIFGTGLATPAWPGSWFTFANTFSGGHLRTRRTGWVEEGRRDLAQTWKKKQGRKRNFKPADFIQNDSAADIRFKIG